MLQVVYYRSYKEYVFLKRDLTFYGSYCSTVTYKYQITLYDNLKVHNLWFLYCGFWNFLFPARKPPPDRDSAAKGSLISRNTGNTELRYFLVFIIH